MLLLSLLAGCFTPDVDPLEIDKIYFENDYTKRKDLVLQPFTYGGLTCPDGSPASFYALYPETLDTPAPIVLFFHAGAFDYVEARADGVVPAFDSSDAIHYSGDNRLTAEWAANKVFETLGLLNETIDPTETNLGILPAKLADYGAFVLMPANCWGDLWHNETGARPNNWELDGGVHREGRYLAWVMSSIANPDADLAARKRAELGLDDLPISLDATGVYIVGLGEGGRAASELRIRDILGDVPSQDAAPIKGMVVDSTIDVLSSLVKDDATFKDINDGLARIYPDHNDDDGDGLIEGDIDTVNGNQRDDIAMAMQIYSLWHAVNKGGLSYPLGFWYSSSDPLVPPESSQYLVALEPTNSAYLQVTDYQDDGHTILNRDEAQADAAVNVLFGL